MHLDVGDQDSPVTSDMTRRDFIESAAAGASDSRKPEILRRSEFAARVVTGKTLVGSVTGQTEPLRAKPEVLTNTPGEVPTMPRQPFNLSS